MKNLLSSVSAGWHNKTALATVVISTVLLSGCGGAISSVKEAPMPGYETMRIGKMWEGYESICDNGEWTEFETERGETIVQYQCSFNPDYYLGKFLSSLKVRNPEDLAAKASEITMGYDVKLIAQYPLAADGESFEVGYAGVSVGGKEMGNESQYIYEQVSEGAYMPLLLEVYAKEEQNKLNAAVRFTLNSNPELYTSDSDLVEINFEQDINEILPKNVYNTAEPIGIFTFGEPYKEDDTMMLDVTVDVVALTDQTLRDFLDYCELAYNPQTSHIHAVYPQDIKTSEVTYSPP